MIDVSNANMIDIAGIHWQVAQATSIQQVYFFQSKAPGKSHMGICKSCITIRSRRKCSLTTTVAENGSGGFMSDLAFVDGAIGIRCK